MLELADFVENVLACLLIHGHHSLLFKLDCLEIRAELYDRVGARVRQRSNEECECVLDDLHALKKAHTAATIDKENEVKLFPHAQKTIFWHFILQHYNFSVLILWVGECRHEGNIKDGNVIFNCDLKTGHHSVHCTVINLVHITANNGTFYPYFSLCFVLMHNLSVLWQAYALYALQRFYTCLTVEVVPV